MNLGNNIQNHYQQHWFSAGLEKFKLEDRSREEKIEITRHEFRRYIHQLTRSDIGKQKIVFSLVNNIPKKDNVTVKEENRINDSGLVSTQRCEIEKCNSEALPCTKQCLIHIMFNSEQVLFEYCTAKFSDNTHCSTPVLDVSHELPLCAEHARKRDNYRLFQEGKPKKLNRKLKISATIRVQKRNKKRRKLLVKSSDTNISNSVIENPMKSSNSDIDEVVVDSSNLEVEDIQIVDQVLDLNGNGLPTQPHLLEENDISNVLKTIQADEFNDFFTINKNGEYEPSREETEELEKALAAVDNDVKSLEKLSQTQGLLDSLLDENTLGETLVQIPEMFNNGYSIPVEQESHS